MENLYYWQKLKLRNSICQIEIEELSQEANWKLQGEMLYKLGFCEREAKYPDDTYVGVHRLNGWESAKKQQQLFFKELRKSVER